MSKHSNRPSGGVEADDTPADRSTSESADDFYRGGSAAAAEEVRPGPERPFGDDGGLLAVAPAWSLATVVAAALTAALLGGVGVLQALGFGAGATGATLLVVNGLFLLAVVTAYDRRSCRAGDCGL